MKVSGQLYTPVALTPRRKESPIPIGKEIRGAPEPVWMGWRREDF